MLLVGDINNDYDDGLRHCIVVVVRAKSHVFLWTNFIYSLSLSCSFFHKTSDKLTCGHRTLGHHINAHKVNLWNTALMLAVSINTGVYKVLVF